MVVKLHKSCYTLDIKWYFKQVQKSKPADVKLPDIVNLELNCSVDMPLNDNSF